MLRTCPSLLDWLSQVLDSRLHREERSLLRVVQSFLFKLCQVYTLSLPCTSNTALPLPGLLTTIASPSFSSVISGKCFL